MRLSNLFVALSLFFCLLGKGSAEENNKCAIVFDFGGVVAQVDITAMKEFSMRTLAMNSQELSSALIDMQAFITDGGSEKQFWEHYASDRKISLPKDWFEQFGTVIQRSITIIPGTVAIIKELKKRGYQIVLHSDMTQYQAEVIGKMGYFDFFDQVILSYQIGFMKTDPSAFKVLLETLCIPASCIIFIDDRKENVETAKTVGIDSLQFISQAQLQQELALRGIVLSRAHSL